MTGYLYIARIDSCFRTLKHESNVLGELEVRDEIVTKLNNEWSKRLYQAISVLKNAEETELFLKDMFATHEVTRIARRWAIANYRMQSKTSAQIEKELHTSSATVSRTNKLLDEGTGMTSIIIKRLDDLHNSSTGAS